MSSVGTLSNYCSFPGVLQVRRHPCPHPRPSLHLQVRTVRGWGLYSGMNSRLVLSTEGKWSPHTGAFRYHLTNPAHITRQRTVSAHPCLPSGTCILCSLTAPLPTLDTCTRVYTHACVFVHAPTGTLACPQMWTHTCIHRNGHTHRETHKHTPHCS